MCRQRKNHNDGVTLRTLRSHLCRESVHPRHWRPCAAKGCNEDIRTRHALLLSSHVGYQLLRKLTKRDGFGVYTLVATACIVILLAYLASGVLAFVIACIAAYLIFQHQKSPYDMFQLAKRFGEVNHNDYELKGAFSANINHPTALNVDFKRVLICERQQFAEFLLRNQWHLLNACPILGPSGDEDVNFPGLLTRIKAHDQSKVFVLHNLTPGGMQFLKTVRTHWFSATHAANIIDLGLSASHLPLFDKLWRPLTHIAGAGSGILAGAPEGQGVEISVFSPNVMMRMLTKSIDDDTPLGEGGELYFEGGDDE